MTIKEESEKYALPADTLRYYEKVGVIPAVKRTKGRIRNYDEESLRWIENAVCMRNAGVSVEKLIEYMRLCQQGDDTFMARRDLLLEVRVQIQEQLTKYQETMDRLDYKISRYEEAVRTGKLTWDRQEV